jgi:hemoglobin
MSDEVTLYDAFGGHDFFEKLVGAFYARVATDDILRPMYPDEDLTDARWRLQMFLEQYWGGPKTYGDVRGHPRLRMRHMPFAIDSRARDRWLTHMRASVDEQHLPRELDEVLWNYLLSAAFAMQNIVDEQGPVMVEIPE